MSHLSPEDSKHFIFLKGTTHLLVFDYVNMNELSMETFMGDLCQYKSETEADNFDKRAYFKFA